MPQVWPELLPHIGEATNQSTLATIWKSFFHGQRSRTRMSDKESFEEDFLDDNNMQRFLRTTLSGTRMSDTEQFQEDDQDCN